MKRRRYAARTGMSFRGMARRLGVTTARAQQLLRIALAKFARSWNRHYPGEPLPLRPRVDANGLPCARKR